MIHDNVHDCNNRQTVECGLPIHREDNSFPARPGFSMNDASARFYPEFADDKVCRVYGSYSDLQDNVLTHLKYNTGHCHSIIWVYV